MCTSRLDLFLFLNEGKRAPRFVRNFKLSNGSKFVTRRIVLLKISCEQIASARINRSSLLFIYLSRYISLIVTGRGKTLDEYREKENCARRRKLEKYGNIANCVLCRSLYATILVELIFVFSLSEIASAYDDRTWRIEDWSYLLSWFISEKLKWKMHEDANIHCMRKQRRTSYSANDHLNPPKT